MCLNWHFNAPCQVWSITFRLWIFDFFTDRKVLLLLTILTNYELLTDNAKFTSKIVVYLLLERIATYSTDINLKIYPPCIILNNCNINLLVNINNFKVIFNSIICFDIHDHLEDGITVCEAKAWFNWQRGL